MSQLSAARCRRREAYTPTGVTALSRSPAASVRKEDRHDHVLEQFAGHPAEHRLANGGVALAAADQHVRADISRASLIASPPPVERSTAAAIPRRPRCAATSVSADPRHRRPAQSRAPSRSVPPPDLKRRFGYGQLSAILNGAVGFEMIIAGSAVSSAH
jgi:hypothetical protein